MTDLEKAWQDYRSRVFPQQPGRRPPPEHEYAEQEARAAFAAGWGEKESKRYMIQGVKALTAEALGNTATVYETFAVMTLDPDTDVPPHSVVQRISELTGLDVILVPAGTKLEVVRVEEHESARCDSVGFSKGGPHCGLDKGHEGQHHCAGMGHGSSEFFWDDEDAV